MTLKKTPEKPIVTLPKTRVMIFWFCLLGLVFPLRHYRVLVLIGLWASFMEVVYQATGRTAAVGTFVLSIVTDVFCARLFDDDIKEEDD